MKITTEGGGRKLYIDIAKCLAIILVVMGHILIYDIYGYEKYRGLSPLIEIIQSVEMPLFTMVSGFVASCKRPFLQSIYKNFRQLLVSFFVFIVCCCFPYKSSIILKR